MAIHYNLAKVFEHSKGDDFLIKQKIKLFVFEIPTEIKFLIANIKNKQYQTVFSLASKIKPTLEMMGMTIAHNEMLEVENWSVKQGKRREIEATIDSIKLQIDKAVKEMKKDFKFFEIINEA